MEAQNHALLCQEIESELRELCLECRKRLPSIKEYTERAILKIRHHRDLVERASGSSALPEFPLHEVLSSILMACETFQSKIVLISLSCLQRLIHRRVLKDETVAIVITLMKEQAANGEEQVQLKVLQTIMATPPQMILAKELVVEQLLQLLYVLHNSSSISVHHTACAGLRQLAESLSDRAALQASEGESVQTPEGADASAASSGSSCARAAVGEELRQIRPVVLPPPAAMPTLTPAQAPSTLSGSLRMLYIFVQDLCVMVDYDASSMSSRYSQDAGERMRIGSREGYWLASVKFPRPLCLELLGTCVATHPEVFYAVPECFALLRTGVCAVLLKNLRGCFDFAILIRCIHLLQQILKCPSLASLLITEMQVFLQLMLDLTTAERSPWQRATSLEFLKSVCEDAGILAVLYESCVVDGSSTSESGPRTFIELVNSLPHVLHQVCFASGLDSGALLQSASVVPRGDSSAMLGRGALLGAGNLLGGASGLLSGASSRDVGAGGGAASLDRDAGASGGASSNATSGGRQSASSLLSMRNTARVKLLTLMSEAEPPVIQPSFLVSLVVECVFAIVATLDRLLLEANGELPTEGSEATRTSTSASTSNSAGGAAGGGNPAAAGDSSQLQAGMPGRNCRPLEGTLSPAQERCRCMFTDCWASLLSALCLLLHGTVDEAFLQQALRCLQTLLYCCGRLGRLGLEQARDACLLQVSRYALPGQSHEGDADAATLSSSGSQGLSMKNVLCFKALLSFCYSSGALLGCPGWLIALRAFDGLEKVLQRASPVQAQDLQSLRQSLDSLFESTVLLPEDALGDIVGAVGERVKGLAESDEGVVLNRLVELCSFNLGRLLVVWSRVLRIILDVCSSDQRGDLRGTAATALCRILAQALRKSSVAVTDRPDTAQEELLQPLEALLHVPHEEARARVCEGLLTILQASGQELHPGAWGTIIHLVAMAAKVELEKAGLDFYLPKSMDTFSPDTKANTNGDANGADSDASKPVSKTPSRGVGSDVRDSSSVLPTVFALLELIVQDFMEYVPPDSVPRLTASIGAFARFTGLGVNSSLTAVGFLWNVADALALYHCAPEGRTASSEASNAVATAPGSDRESPEELWIQIFMHLRVLAVDGRPEVRNCAVKSLTSALLSHGRKVGTSCYQRCLQDILIQVLAEIQNTTKQARGKASPAGLIVHHSRDTLEKQWDETMVLGIESVRRVLSNFAEEAGVIAFAPLAYTLLLQVQTTLQALNPEVSGSALRALVDLMRTPTSGLPFDVQSTLRLSQELPAPDTGQTSVWLLGWTVLWQMVNFAMSREMPEPLMETFVSTLSLLRSSHRHLFTPAQHAVLLEMALVLITAPGFYLTQSTPLQLPDLAGDKDTQGHAEAMASAITLCSQHADAQRSSSQGGPYAPAAQDREVFAFVERSPEVLWRYDLRAKDRKDQTYSKAPIAISTFVSANTSRNLDARSMEGALRGLQLDQPSEGAASADDSVQAFLGSQQSPTHRTMLHSSTYKLSQCQSHLFRLLEETPGFSEPFLEVFFITQLCALFLDARRVLLDTNKFALAARALCLLILFCRRVLFHNLSQIVLHRHGTTQGGAEGAKSTQESGALAHVEAFIGAMPHLFRVVAALVCIDQAGPKLGPLLQESGLWKLALEALLYLIEDSLPALEHCNLNQRCVSEYWRTVMDTLASVVSSVVPSDAGRQPKPEAGAAGEADLLVQAAGNLIAHRLLACKSAPPEVSERAVKLLGDLVGLQSDLAGVQDGGSRRPACERATLGHLFDLCACVEQGGDGVAEACEQSIAAMSARSGGVPRPPPQSVDREALLRSAVPALLTRVRAVLLAYSEEDSSAAASGREVPQHRLDEVRFVLSRLKALRVDSSEFVSAAPCLAGQHAPAELARRARAACEMAGPRGCAMALLPQLGTLACAGDPQVRTDVKELIEALSGELGLLGI